eukprot:jgi/Undpi1/12752/HiC_scaffold_6.g02420.m1
MLMHGVSFGTLTIINILLEAGADEKTLLAAQAGHPKEIFSPFGGLLVPSAAKRSPTEEAGCVFTLPVRKRFPNPYAVLRKTAVLEGLEASIPYIATSDDSNNL